MSQRPLLPPPSFPPWVSFNLIQLVISESTFFQIALAAMRYVQWLNFFWLLPLVLWLRNKRTMRPTTMLVDACLVSLLLRSIEA